MFKHWFLLFLLLLSSSSFALQTVLIGDDQTRNIDISAYDLTRIFVKGDRIQNVRGLEGAYFLIKDAGQGQVYLKPSLIFQQKPFNLFITTEQGHNYNLFIQAKGVPGQDIELKPTTPSRVATIWEKNSAYSQVLLKLIAAMMNDDPPDGYAVLYPDKKLKPVKYSNFNIKLQKSYHGDHLYGEALIIQNQSRETITISETMFYQTNTRAVALADLSIPPKGQTMLYRVMSND